LNTIPNIALQPHNAFFVAEFVAYIHVFDNIKDVYYCYNEVIFSYIATGLYRKFIHLMNIELTVDNNTFIDK
jgi:hypothetical protein